MRRVVLALLVALWCVPSDAQFFGASTDINNAIRAYTDMTTRFWYGAASTGYPKVISATGAAVGIDAAQVGPAYSNFWGDVAVSTDVLYTCWKICPATQSADALVRLGATWNFVKSFWKAANYSACGTDATNPLGVAQDDMAWDALALLQLQEATGAALAGTYAEAALNCAYGRWYDTVTGGGLYYDDSQTSKGSYQAQFVLDLLIDYAQNGTSSSLSEAIAIESWAATATGSCACLYQASTGLWFATVNSGNQPTWDAGTTYRPGQIATYSGTLYCALARFNTGNQPNTSPTWWTANYTPSNGYCSSGASTSAITVPAQGTVRGSLPSGISMAGSSTFLAGNMAWAVVDVRLYNNSCLTTCNSAYLTRAQATAAAILTYETLPANSATGAAGQGLGGGPFGQMLLDDRDAFTNGADAWYFANEVVPVLTNPQPWVQVYLNTARSIVMTARDAYGGYYGDWQGASAKWIAAGNGSTPYSIQLSTSAAMWPIAALKWATK